jgi:hypothetical protein
MNAARRYAEWWGSTPAERARSYPAAKHVPGTMLYRAVDVAAPAHTVYTWLCQLRAAPYSYDLLDNLGRRSPQERDPDLQHLEVGQRAVTIFEIAEFEEDRSLTIVLRRGSRLFGRVALTYDVRPSGPGSSRLVAALSITRPQLLLVWGDLFMMRKQLLNLARLAEQS